MSKINLTRLAVVILATVALGFLCAAFAQDDERDSGDWSVPRGTGTGSAEDEKEIDPDNLVLVGRKNDEVNERIQAARASDFEKAARIYQDIIEKSRGEYSEAFVSTGPKSEALFVPAREFCLREIQKFPEDARAKYNALFGPQAEARFQTAIKSRDFAAVEDLAISSILTDAGRRSAEIMADSLAARGEYYNAVYYLELLDAFHPNDRTPARTALRAYCLLMLGDPDGAKKIARDLERSAPNAQISAAGRKTTAADFVASLLKRVPDRPAQTGAFNLFRDSTAAAADNADEAFAALDVLTVDDGEYWQSEVAGQATQSRYARRYYPGDPRMQERQTGGPCYIYPVIADGGLFYRTRTKVGAIDLATGKFLWYMNTDDSSREMEFYYPGDQMDSMTRRPLTLEFDRGVLYFVAGSASGQSKLLRAIQFSGGSFRELWSVKEGEEKDSPRNNTVFASNPVAAGGKVFIAAYVSIAGKEMKLVSLAFDGLTGRRLWSADLCTVPTTGYYSRFMGAQSSNVPTLAESRSRLFIQSNIGIVACVSTHTGDVKWIKKYARPEPKNMDPWGGMRTLAQTSWEFFPPAVYRPQSGESDEEVLIAAPRDSNSIMGIDPETGLTRYEIDNQYPGDRYMAGPWNGFVFAYGKPSEQGRNAECLHAYDAASGKLLLELEIEKFQARGKALIAGDVLYLPGASGVTRVKLSADNIAKCAVIETKEWPAIPDEQKESTNGNIIIAGKRFIVVGGKYIRSFAFPPEPAQEAPDKKSGKDKPKQTPKNDWR